MKDLIDALTIFAKYTEDTHPTCCAHGALYVNVEYKAVSEEDRERLYELSFFKSDNGEGFMSFRFGSC
jgi:hypothetical protein